MSAWQKGYVTVNGTKLHYHRTGGSKPTVVLAHGITDNGLCWTRLARALEHHYDLVLYDARGHGSSDQPGHYALEDHVADAVGLIETLELSRPILLGHSMGGANLPVVAARLPEVIGGLVLEDPHWPLEPEDEHTYNLETWRNAISLEKTQPLETLLALGKNANPRWAEEELHPWAQAKKQVDPDVVRWLDSRHELNSWREILKQIQCRVLLVMGDTDVTVTPQVAKEAKQLCSTLEVVQLQDAGHSIRRDQFATYLEAVAAFLKKIVRT
jgi:N-formylmaleamate deformylase